MFEFSESFVLFVSSIFIMYRLRIDQQSCAFAQEKSLSIEKRIAKNQEADYVKENEKFSSLFLKEGTNINIHPDLYCDKTFKNNHDQDWCIVENMWKSRILFQNTLQGNVIMYYDIYKMAFVYYSDMQISYKWLNYCAMKYVRIFYCRDFFLDDSFLPATIKNPFNQNKIKGEKEDIEKKEEKKKKMEIDFHSEVFLKRKEIPTKKPKEIKPPKEEMTEKFVNNFRYMGKLINYSFLQTPDKKQEKICENYQYIDFKMKFKQATQLRSG